MSKTVKRALSLLLCVAMLCGAAPLNGFVGLELPKFSSIFASVAHAADPTSGTCGDNLTWEYDTSTKTLTISGTGEMSNYGYSGNNGTILTTAPWKTYYSTMKTLVIGNRVTGISSYAFSGCTALTSATISDSVTSIGRNTFEDCTGLTSVTIGISVKSIGQKAFKNCIRLQEVQYNAVSVSDLGSYSDVFSNAGVSGVGLTVIFGDSVSRIPDYLFDSDLRPNLKTVIIGNNVIGIGYAAFSRCTELIEVKINNLATWCGISFRASSSNPLYYAHKLYLNNVLVKNLIIPDGVTSISNYAFYRCDSLTSVTIPNSVTKIGSSAFEDCTGLTSVNIPNGVTIICPSAFSNCKGLTSVTIPNSVKSIYYDAFCNCTGLVKIYYHAANADDSMYNWYETSSGAFRGCGTAETGVSVIFGNSVERIPDYLFNKCSNLNSVTISNSVKSIGNYAFNGCAKLTNITIPDSVTNIGNNAFYSCSKLKDVYYPGGKNQWSNINIGGSNTNLTNATIHYNSSGPGNPENPENPDDPSGNIAAPDGTTISFLQDEATHHTNEEFPISGELYSPNGTNGITLEWTVSDSNGLSLNLPASMQNTDANHIIFSVLATGNEEGDYTIKVTTSNGASSTRKVAIGDIHAKEFDPESTSGIYQINGRLENYGVSTNINTGHSYTSTIKINGKWYNVTKDLISEEQAKQMKGKDVICNINSNIKEIIAISKCRDFTDLSSSDIDNIKNTNGKRISVKIDNEYRWVRGKVYKDGGSTAVGSIPFQIMVYNSIPSEYFDLSDSCKKDSAFVIEISNITISGKSNCGEIRLYDNSFPKTIKLGESLYLNGDILLPSDFWLGYEDSEKIISAEYEIQLKSGERIKNTFQTVVKNRDSKIVTGNENNALTDAANKLKRTPTSAISLDGLSEIGFTLAQINYLEKLVLVELSLYTIPGDSLEEYVSKKVMEKIFGAKSAVGVKSGKMTIVIPAEYQDRDIQVDIVCDITDYTLMDRTFGNFTNLTYHAYDLKKNGKREKYAFKEDGFAGLSVSANVEEFAKAATDLAMGEIKTASKTALSGYEEVERMIFGDTALKILSAAGYNSAFDLGWDLYVNECKKLTYKCPVDIYVYDKDDHLCGAIVNNMVTLNASDAVDLEVTNDEKSVTLWEDGYYIKTLSDCSGTLNISISEKGYVNGIVRALTFENLPLEIGTIYQQGCGTGYYDDQEAYAVEQLNGDTIQATTDTLCIEALKKFTVIYNANDGIVPESSKTVCEGEYVILPTATREGYRFLGWSTSNDNTSDFESGSALEMTADVTLYAVWQKNETPAKPAVKSVALNDVTINYKSSTTLKPQITADEGAKCTPSYSTSDPNVVKVNEKTGEVTGAKRGSATITCTVTDEFGTTVKDTCKVTVSYSAWQWVIIILLFGWIWY